MKVSLGHDRAHPTKPTPLQSVKPSTIISGASPSLSQSNYGKRDLSREGWSTEKLKKIATDWTQADEHSNHSGTSSHQAEIQSNSNEQQLFKVPENITYSANDIRYSHQKRDIAIQHEQDQGQGRTAGGVAVQSQASYMPLLPPGAFSQNQHLWDQSPIKENWKCSDCNKWNVSCTKRCRECHIDYLKAKVQKDNPQCRY